jgi:Uma2 family endonuclease
LFNPLFILVQNAYFCISKEELHYNMNATIPAGKELTLEQLMLRHGAIEFQNPMSKEEFVSLAERYPDLPMEREKNGTVTIMSPVKRGSSKRESTLIGLLFMWNHQYGLGELHSPSGGFNLPDGAIKSPDAAWISPERLAAAADDDDEHFITIIPDFVVEVRSGSDRLKKLQKKMTDTWMANGVRLAWLIDPYEEKAYIYRYNHEVETIENFKDKVLSGELVLPGFELPLNLMRRK